MRIIEFTAATLIIAALLAAPAAAQMPRTAAPADAKAYIQSPADGATVSSPVDACAPACGKVRRTTVP